MRRSPGLPEPLSPETIAKAAELQAADCKVAVEKKSKATANKTEDAESCYRTAEDYYYGNNGKPEDEAIVVENAPLGVTAGVAAGLFTIAANTGPLKDEVLSKAGASLVFPSMQTLCDEWKKLFEALK